MSICLLLYLIEWSFCFVVNFYRHGSISLYLIYFIGSYIQISLSNLSVSSPLIPVHCSSSPYVEQLLLSILIFFKYCIIRKYVIFIFIYYRNFPDSNKNGRIRIIYRLVPLICEYELWSKFVSYKNIQENVKRLYFLMVLKISCWS